MQDAEKRDPLAAASDDNSSLEQSGHSAGLPAMDSPEIIALDRACVRKLDFTVLPLCAMFYFLSFLDGNAKIAGLTTDLKLTSHQYLVAITVTYVPYIAFELPSNLLLKKVGPQIMLPAMVTCWGIVCTLTGLAHNYKGLLALRFFLGALEGGLFPGIVLYLSTFYRRRELQMRISLFFSAASLSGAFSGLLAAAIIKMNHVGGQAGWRWIFYLEGIFTVLFGLLSFFLLPGTPSASRYLTPVQKAHIVRRLALDRPSGTSEQDDGFTVAEVGKAFTSPQVMILAVALFGNGCTLFSFAYFTPTIVATFKYSTIRTQLLTVPPYVCAFVVTLITAYLSDRYQRRSFCVIAMSLLSIIGYAIFLTSTSRHALYGSLFLSVTGIYSTAPALTTWLPNNSASHYRKATAVAIGFICTNSGGILSTWLFPAKEAPRYRKATIVNMSLAVVTGLFGLLNLLYLIQANKAKKRRSGTNGGENNLATSADDWYIQGDRHPDFKYTY